MSAEALQVQFLEWLSERPRSYNEAMDAWRSHCPRHTIWEDALADGLISLSADNGRAVVQLTAKGRAVLQA